MRHIIDKIELNGNEIILTNPSQEPISVMEVGEDLVISTDTGLNYIVINSKTFVGALKALTAKGERDRLNAKDRN